MRTVCRENFGNATENFTVSQSKINDDSAAKMVEGGDLERLCLFPAKILSKFLHAHDATKARVEMVLEQKGVGRKAMRVWWTSFNCIEIYPRVERGFRAVNWNKDSGSYIQSHL
jgi:hypothetical protein